MTDTARNHTSPITAVRIAGLAIVWLAVAFLSAPRIGLYYEALAVWFVVPELGLTYAYCLTHRSRTTASLAVVATVAAVAIIGFAIVIPKGSAA